MLRSMTGFGRAEGMVKQRKVTVEIRSLNSKQLDLSIKLPAAYRDKEAETRKWLGEHVQRGKCEVHVGSESVKAEKRSSFDRDLIRSYYGELREIADELHLKADADLLGHVLRLPDVVMTSREQVDPEEWASIGLLMEEALQAFQEFRRNEGAVLHKELSERCTAIGELLQEVGTMDDGRVERTRRRLKEKLEELAVKVDADRFEQELVFYLEKLDVTEEKVRLAAHLTYFQETLDGEEQQGRKLNFIGQEMGREINTLGSKANDAAMQRLVVRMKDELEKIKEQALNVL